MYKFAGMPDQRVCYTIHNFKHQGVTGMEVLRASGLDRPEYYSDYDRLRDNLNPGAINLMKGGIVYSNFVTTVSPQHAWETRFTDMGYGLGHTLHIHQQKFDGVLNGVDYDVWNPAIDPFIPYQYSADNLDEKYHNKEALRHRLLLRQEYKPLIAYIGRLDVQKGVDLIRHGLFYSIWNNAQFVLLGSSPQSDINAYFWHLKHHLNDNPDCHLELGFDEELSHLIYAGADMIIVPSNFEPCGLTQLVGMKYGTVPIVRAVGGLVDTVFDKDYHYSKPLNERNGFVFHQADYSGVESSLNRGIRLWYDYPEDFRELMLNGMRYDYSWNLPGQRYLEIYDLIRHK
jgi:starch synthase